MADTIDLKEMKLSSGGLSSDNAGAEVEYVFADGAIYLRGVFTADDLLNLAEYMRRSRVDHKASLNKAKANA